MKNNKKIWIASAALLLVAGVAFASQKHQEYRNMHKMFSYDNLMQRTDTNGDLLLSVEELLALLNTRFNTADQDSNEVLTKSEIIGAIESLEDMPFLQRHSGRISDQMVERFDINQDGKLAKSEIENRLRKFYALVDWNDDGAIEEAEINKLREHHRFDHDYKKFMHKQKTERE